MKGSFTQIVFTSFLISCLVFIAKSGIGQQQAVGTIGGAFSVSDLGAANYTIPLKFPKGINGIKLNLSLNYKSQSGNDILGMGWHLGGLSVITRTGRNIYVDYMTQGVALNSEDRFSLDGQRLILTSSGSYGGPGTEYATEMDSYYRIVANNGGGTMFNPLR